MKRIFTLLTAVLITAAIFGQSPEKFSYQAVIRNSGGVLVQSQAVGIKISILQGSAGGSSVYVESHNVITNTNGLATLEIGAGSVVSGNFGTITWSAGPYFLKTETDPTGGTTYTIEGTGELLSTPYALYAKTSEGINGTLTSSQISDFQTSVTNNSAVLLNSAKNSYPAADATKLAGISTGAEVNVNADWNSVSGDALVLNKPILFDGAYSSLTGTPALFDGNYNNLTNQPILFNGAYSSLTGTPAIPTTTSQLTNNSGFISSYTETDPVFSGLINITSPANNQLLKYNSGSGKWENWTSDFITGFTEADPIWTAASVNYYTKASTDAGFAQISHIHADATTSVSGLLSGTDKTKLNGLQNADGSETKLVSGTNVLITGSGTTGNPYTVNASSSSWGLTGNAGTVDGTSFIGTTDGVSLNFRVNNQKAGRIDVTWGNTFLGQLSGNLNTSGNQNSAFGSQAMSSNTIGNRNTAIGVFALSSNNEGVDNTAVGLSALFNNLSDYNTAIGSFALYSNTTGTNNTALGRQAGRTAVQANANTTGSNNTFIGYNSGPGTPTQLNNATAIGYNALVTTNNSLVLGGTGANAVKVGIGVTAPTAKLDISSGGSGVLINLDATTNNQTSATIQGVKINLRQTDALATIYGV